MALNNMPQKIISSPLIGGFDPSISRNQKIWLTAVQDADCIKALSGTLNIPPMIARVFLNRGVSDPAFIQDFLSPDLASLHDPMLLQDMPESVARINQAIQAHEKIIIYGDYDVDGITSTAILYDYLHAMGADVHFYIPDRIDEGYGLSMHAVENVLTLSPSLIITVDCGIASIEEVVYIRRKNIDIIITDHHECREILPPANAVVNPHRHDSTYPYANLAGVGVVFKLIHALSIANNQPGYHLRYLDLVTVGTIADVVPLTGENRVIVSHGLKAIENTTNEGLKTLIQSCNFKDSQLNSYCVAFSIAPRINASGRLGNPREAVELFISRSIPQIQDISIKLNEENRTRQETESGILESALLEIESDPAYRNEPIIVVSGKYWHHGVIGIVASRILERYYKPVIVISKENGSGKGSARSISEFNLFDALMHCRDLLQRFGGHKAAAGLTLREENIEPFRTLINEYARERLTPFDLTPKVHMDGALSPEEITIAATQTLDMLAPFGQDNAKPLFLAQNFTILDVRPVGDGKHLKLSVSKNNHQFDAIAFHFGKLSETMQTGDVYDLAFYPEINVWNQVSKVQLHIKDIRKNQQSLLEEAYDASFEAILATDHENISDDTEDEIAMPQTEQNISPIETLEALRNMIFTQSLVDKTLILLNNPGTASAILDDFSSHNYLPVKDYLVPFFEPQKNMLVKVELLINPNFSNLQKASYSNVVLAGSLLQSKNLHAFIHEFSGKLYQFNGSNSDTPIENVQISRNDIAGVYKYFSSRGHKKVIIPNLHRCISDISRHFHISLNRFKFLKILEILTQLHIIHLQNSSKSNIIIEMIENCEKTNLENSKTFNTLHGLKFLNTF